MQSLNYVCIRQTPNFSSSAQNINTGGPCGPEKQLRAIHLCSYTSQQNVYKNVTSKITEHVVGVTQR